MATRRSLLTATAATGAAVVFSGVLGGIGRAFAQGAPVVRRSLHGMSLDDPDLVTYRDFVGYMLRQDQSRPVSWLQYSLLHGNADTGQFKYCPHGDWYFLPWHRAYVAMYETAARALIGKADFAMPYWDWTVDRTMPQAFTDSTYKGKPNPLYVPGRTLSNPSRWPLPDSIVGPAVMSKIYAQTTYQSFGTSKNPRQNSLDESWVVAGGGVQGTLEATPHNNVHNFIGAFMPTAGSPRDPIFMMHHCNIDRIWAYWNALGRRNSDGMSADDWKLWNGMTFTNNYLSPTGVPYTAAVAGLQNTLALGYTYGNLPQHDGQVEDPERTRRLLALFATGSAPETLENLQVLTSPNRQAARVDRALVKEVALPQSLRAMVAESAPGTARYRSALRRRSGFLRPPARPRWTPPPQGTAQRGDRPHRHRAATRRCGQARRGSHLGAAGADAARRRGGGCGAVAGAGRGRSRRTVIVGAFGSARVSARACSPTRGTRRRRAGPSRCGRG